MRLFPRSGYLIYKNAPREDPGLCKELSMNIIDKFSLDLRNCTGWCERRLDNNKDTINILPFVSCGKITINLVTPRLPVALWEVTVNVDFNLLLNFTRLEMDSSFNQCLFSKLSKYSMI